MPVAMSVKVHITYLYLHIMDITSHISVLLIVKCCGGMPAINTVMSKMELNGGQALAMEYSYLTD